MTLDINTIYHGDCLDLMKDIPDKSIDMILCDLPYGTTACKWDTIIPFEPLWEQYKRIIKDNGAIVLFGSEPFSSKLRMSNMDMYKYDWYWIKDKTKVGNFLHSKNMPLKNVETISIFSKGIIAHANANRMTYNPQGLLPYGKVVKGTDIGGKTNSHKFDRPSNKEHYIREFTNYPTCAIEFKHDWVTQLHPTQKPVLLLEYLIKTYTNEGDLVLDNCMGSGTTAVACINTGRNFIGIEKDEEYFNIAQKRVKEAQGQGKLEEYI